MLHFAPFVLPFPGKACVFKNGNLQGPEREAHQNMKVRCRMPSIIWWQACMVILWVEKSHFNNLWGLSSVVIVGRCCCCYSCSRCILVLGSVLHISLTLSDRIRSQGSSVWVKGWWCGSQGGKQGAQEEGVLKKLGVWKTSEFLHEVQGPVKFI